MTDTPGDRAHRDTSLAFTEAFPAWHELSRRAGRVLAAGAMHDSQLLGPIEPFFDRAHGPYKWSGERRFAAEVRPGRSAKSPVNRLPRNDTAGVDRVKGFPPVSRLSQYRGREQPGPEEISK